MMPRACSELADLVIRNDVRALNNCEPAIPARMICPAAVVPRDECASSATSENAATAPAKAPADIEMAPAPKPRMATSTAPVEAPAEIPSK